MNGNEDTSKHGERILEQLRKVGPFLSASFVVRNKRCGREDCRCAKEGPIHPTANLTWKEHGKTQTLHVPKELIEEVEQWVEQWRVLKKLVQKMSQEQRKHLVRLRNQLKG